MNAKLTMATKRRLSRMLFVNLVNFDTFVMIRDRLDTAFSWR
jgi:hypothetical protein